MMLMLVRRPGSEITKLTVKFSEEIYIQPNPEIVIFNILFWVVGRAIMRDIPPYLTMQLILLV